MTRRVERPSGYRRAPVKRSPLRLLVPVVGVLVVVASALWVARNADAIGKADASPVAAAKSAVVAAELKPLEVPEPEPTVEAPEDPPAPADSGKGKRIIYHQTQQRMWLMDNDESVVRTYLVSGSRFDNLKPGNYSIMSRQRHGVAFDHSGTFEYFMRFATGWSEPIGFHAIPYYNDGTPEQTEAELGTRRSAGCVRQAPDDAKFLWDWAPDGTPVVVIA